MKSALTKCKSTEKYSIAIILVLLIALIASIIVLSTVPPVSKDALVHHLAIPKLYLDHGGIYEIPSAQFSYYPMNLDLLYLVPLYFGNDIVPKYIHFVFALLTALLIFNYLKDRLNVISGLLGVLFFLSIPVVIKLSITIYVDLGLIFFSTAALLSLLRWLESDFQFKFLIIASVFCGLAMGTKYNGLITFVLLTLSIPFLYSRANPSGKSSFFWSIGHCLSFVVIALLVFSPWLIRNYHWTGNPIFPLYNHLFNPQSASGPTIGVFAYRSLLYHESWWEIALLPIRIFFQGQDNNPQYFDGKLTSFLFIFPIFAFLKLKMDSMVVRNEKIILMAFSVLYFFIALFISTLRIRYITPIIPPLLILSIYGIKNLLIAIKRINNMIIKNVAISFVIVIIFGYFIYGVNYIIEQYKTIKPGAYIIGKVTRDEYIDKYRPEYSLMKYINQNLPYNSKILFIFMGNRGYYCERDYIFDMYGYRSALQETVKIAGSAEKIWVNFVKEGITHLLINKPLFTKWLMQNFPQKDQELVGAFFSDYLCAVSSNKGYHLYRLKSIAAAEDKAEKDPPIF